MALEGGLAAHAIVDNRPGAAGQIAIGVFKNAPDDGSTVLLAQGAIATTYPSLYQKLAYDPAADLRPVSLAGEMALGLAVGPAVPASVVGLGSFLDWMKQNPDAANVGSPGTGTLPHLLEVMLFKQAGLSWQHVVYPGGPPAIVSLLGGQIAALVLPEGLLRPHAATGRVRMLATSGAERASYSPGVPTFREQGFAMLEMLEWFAFFMPGRASDEVVDEAAAALRIALVKPELVAAFAEAGIMARWSSPAVLRRRIATERLAWDVVIRNAGVKAE